MKSHGKMITGLVVVGLLHDFSMENGVNSSIKISYLLFIDNTLISFVVHILGKSNLCGYTFLFWNYLRIKS